MAQERGDLEQFDNGETPASTSLAASDGTDDDSFNEETERIKEQIEDTRGQMGETIDAIQDRLSFTNLSEQVSDHVQNALDTAKDAVYDATIGRMSGIMKNIGNGISGSSIARVARKNPLPFILIGVGAGMLAYKSYTGRSGRGRSYGRRLQDGSESRSSGTQAKVSKAGSAVESVRGALDSAYTGATDIVDRARIKAGDLTGVAREQYDTHLQEHPLVLGAAALALGAAVGMAIPATTYEREMLGETRDKVIDLATETASGLLDQTKEAISGSEDAGSGQGSSTSVS